MTWLTDDCSSHHVMWKRPVDHGGSKGNTAQYCVDGWTALSWHHWSAERQEELQKWSIHLKIAMLFKVVVVVLVPPCMMPIIIALTLAKMVLCCWSVPSSNELKSESILDESLLLEIKSITSGDSLLWLYSIMVNFCYLRRVHKEHGQKRGNINTLDRRSTHVNHQNSSISAVHMTQYSCGRRSTRWLMWITKILKNFSLPHDTILLWQKKYSCESPKYQAEVLRRKTEFWWFTWAFLSLVTVFHLTTVSFRQFIWK